MAGDLWALYRFQVDMLSESPAFTRIMLELVARLGHEPMSFVRVLQSRDVNVLGWTATPRALGAVVEELRVLQALIVGMFSDKGTQLPELKPYEGRPGASKAQSAPKSIPGALAKLGIFAGEAL